MDALELKPGSSRGAKPLLVRVWATWLAALLALGLWQGYGAWLLSGAAVHVS